MDPHTPNPFHNRQPYTGPVPSSYDQSEHLKIVTVAGLLLAVLMPPIGIVVAIFVLIKHRDQLNQRIGIVSILVGALLSMIYGFFLIPTFLNYLSTQAAEQDSRAKSHAVELQKGVGIYRLRNGSYPTTSQMQDDKWLTSNITTNSDTLTYYTSTSIISYRATPDGCKGNSEKPCTGFVYNLKLSTGTKELRSVPYTPATDSD